uniref:Uncharacterized protein n=1 Tax=Timema cristinae TaxID=61476 RepID=A0A7R9D2S7_TIMCR|nr:unnamed protein product [Timema cristinae]
MEGARSTVHRTTKIENYDHIFSHKKSNENPVNIDDFPGAAGVALTILTIALTTVTVVYVVLCRLAASSRRHEKVSYYEMLTPKNHRRFVVTNPEMCQKLQDTIPSIQRKDQRMGVQILLTFKPTQPPPPPEMEKTSRTKCCILRSRFESPQATVSIREVDNGDVSSSASSCSKPQTEQSLDATVPGFEQDSHNDNCDEIKLIYHSRFWSLQPSAVLKSLPICCDSDLHDSNNIGRKEHESNNTKADMSLEIFEDPNNSFSCKGKKITSTKSDTSVCGNNRIENEESFLTKKVAAQTRALEDDNILTLTEIDNENLASQFTMYDYKNNSITPDTDVPDKKLEITKSKSIIEMSANDDISRVGKANSEIPFRNVKQERVEAGGFVGSSLEDISRKICELNHRRGIRSCCANHQKEFGRSSSSDNSFLSLKKLDIPLTEGTQNRADDGNIGKKDHRLESRLKAMENRLRLEELRNRSYSSRVTQAETNLLKLGNQLDILDAFVGALMKQQQQQPEVNLTRQQGLSSLNAASISPCVPDTHFPVFVPSGPPKQFPLVFPENLHGMIQNIREEFRNASSSHFPAAPSYLSTPSSGITESEEIWQQLTERAKAKIKLLPIRPAVPSEVTLGVDVPCCHSPERHESLFNKNTNKIMMAGEDMKDRPASSSKEDDVTKPIK